MLINKTITPFFFLLCFFLLPFSSSLFPPDAVYGVQHDAGVLERDSGQSSQHHARQEEPDRPQSRDEAGPLQDQRVNNNNNKNHHHHNNNTPES